MVPEDLLRIRFVSDPQLHPDGRRVAFVVTTLSEARDEYLSTIWIVDVDGGEPRQFTRGPRRDTAPRWSPDGRWLAFVSEREKKGKGQLYVMPADGGEPVRLTDLRPGVASPAWSPDGQWLAFVSRVGGWEEPTDEEERERSKPPRIIDILRYKSNGVGFIYDRPQQIFVVPSAGGSPRQLTAGSFENHHPAWAPDGQHVAFVSARHDERDEDGAADVFTVPVGGGDARQITRTMGPVSWPVYSADGRTVAYIGHAHARAVSRHHRLYTVPAVGGAPQCLTETLDRNCEPMMGAVGPQWLGKTGTLLFQVEDQGDVPLYRISGAGDDDAERLIGGTRQVTAFSASADGHLDRLHGHRRHVASRAVRVPGRWKRRATPHRSEPGLEGRGGAIGSRALPVRPGGLHRRRLGDAAARAAGGAAIPRAPQHPRRTGKSVRPPLL